MGLFKLRAEGKEYDLKVTKSMPFGGEQSTVIYESAGGDGGVVLTTGRLTQKIALNGLLLGTGNSEIELRVDLNNRINELCRLRDNAIPVKLIAPISQNNTGMYIISSFNGTVNEGMMKGVDFSLGLTEYKQRGVKRTSVNLVNFQPAELLKMRAKDRNILAG